MIRAALNTLGFRATGLGAGALFFSVFGMGASAAQDAARVFQTCGGTQVAIAPAGGARNDGDLAVVQRILHARLGGHTGQAFRSSQIAGGQVILSLPDNFGALDVIDSMLSRVSMSFHTVYTTINTGRDVTLARGQAIVPDSLLPDYSYIIDVPAVLDGRDISTATPVLDGAQRPAVAFTFTPQGADTFATFTHENIGRRFAIVLDGVVLSAPTVRDTLTGGRGILTGDFTLDAARNLAASLDGGVLPFDLVIVGQTRVNGSNPSADFCP